MTAFQSNCLWRLLVAGALFGLLAGCESLTSREVIVDAINDPKLTPGLSYRLVSRVNPALSTRGEPLNNKAVAYVVAALATRGLFEAPEKVVPDMIIELDYGVGQPTPHVYLGNVREKYLQLLARRYNERAPVRQPGDELWSVKVSVEERSPNIEPCLPVLATVAGDYAGTNTLTQKRLSISDKDPAVVLVKSAVPEAGKKR
jgi:hypothetical protein